MARIKVPLWYFGGKGHLARKIIPLLPKHKIYVEPFGGGAAVLLNKPPSEVEVYNDIDSGVVDFFRVLKDKEEFVEFQRLVSLTPCSRQEYADARDSWQQEQDRMKRAALWFTMQRQSFSGKGDSGWSFAVTVSRRGMVSAVSGYLSAIENLPEFADRLLRVQIENRDYKFIFDTYDTPETLFYCDPPYILSKRSGGDAYRYEMTLAEHLELVSKLLKLKGKAVLSCYDHAMFAPLLAEGWNRYDFNVAAPSAGKTKSSGLQGAGNSSKQRRNEVLWIKDF